MSRTALLCLSVCLWCSSSAARATAGSFVELHGLDTGLALGSKVAYLADPEGTLGLNDVMRVPDAAFMVSHEEVPNFGLSRAHFWFRVDLRGRAEPQRVIAELAYPILDEVDFFLVATSGRVVSRLATGSHRPFAARTVAHRNLLFPFSVAPHETVRLYLRVRSGVGMQLPLTLWSEHGFMAHDQSATLLQGMYAGFMIVMMLYNLFLFAALRERTYLLYVAMVGGQLSLQLILQGLASQFLWPALPALTRALGPPLFFFANWSASAFASAFLDLPRYSLRWHNITRVVRAACLVGMVASPFFSFDLSVALICGVSFLGASTVLVAFVVIWNEARRRVVMLGLAWMPLLLGTLLIVAEKFGLIPRGFWTENLIQIGSAIEVVVLSIALGDRINYEREQKLSAQELALTHERAAQRAEHDALIIQRRANETLEERVELRTRELAEANARLSSLRTIDPLTGLRNRRYFAERFYEEFARAVRDQAPLTVLRVGIDRFEHIDAKHGRATGDQCVCAVADELRATASRATDTVTHHSAEDFVILLPGTDRTGAAQVAEAVRANVEALTLEADGELVGLTVSVGLTSAVPQREQPREAMLAATGRALERARRRGGNRVEEEPLEDPGAPAQV